MADNLTLDVELLREKGGPEKPIQIVTMIWQYGHKGSIWFFMERPPLTGSMKDAISGIMKEEVAFLQTYTLQGIDYKKATIL